MSSVYHKVAPILRTVATLLLILAIGIKTSTVVATAMGFKKDLAVTEKAVDNEDKKAETDDRPEKETETATLNTIINQPLLHSIAIVHQTAYFINYSISFNQKITIPPPDLNVSLFV